MVTFNFGKHRGRHPSEVPREYLEWALETVRDLDPRLRLEIEFQLGRDTAPPQGNRASGLDQVADEAVAVANDRWVGAVRRIYRDLAFEYHPDRGGLHQTMTALNEFRDRLEEAMGVA
jgi:hypothetical protein